MTKIAFTRFFIITADLQGHLAIHGGKSSNTGEQPSQGWVWEIRAPQEVVVQHPRGSAASTRAEGRLPVWVHGQYGEVRWRPPATQGCVLLQAPQPRHHGWRVCFSMEVDTEIPNFHMP